jgi:AhpD family alkylhydroperoxidase
MKIIRNLRRRQAGDFAPREEPMFDEINDIRRTRKRINAEMFRSGVDTFRAFEDVEAGALRGGTLDGRYKELIALGISIVEKCYPCVEYHTSAAIAGGATRTEVTEAVAVAVALGGGVAQWPARFAFKVLDEIEQEAPDSKG